MSLEELENKTVKNLKTIAKSEGIDLKSGMRKSDIIDTIRSSREKFQEESISSYSTEELGSKSAKELKKLAKAKNIYIPNGTRKDEILNILGEMYNKPCPGAKYKPALIESEENETIVISGTVVQKVNGGLDNKEIEREITVLLDLNLLADAVCEYEKVNRYGYSLSNLRQKSRSIFQLEQYLHKDYKKNDVKNALYRTFARKGQSPTTKQDFAYFLIKYSTERGQGYTIDLSKKYNGLQNYVEYYYRTFVNPSNETIEESEMAKRTAPLKRYNNLYGDLLDLGYDGSENVDDNELFEFFKSM